MLGGDGGFATARWREPASSDRLPSHRSESPTGYSSAGCSPAEPASASPVTDNSSSILIQRGNQIRCSTFTAVMPCRIGRVRHQPECHFYFARRVTFLPCADIDTVPDHWQILVAMPPLSEHPPKPARLRAIGETVTLIANAHRYHGG